MRGSLNAQLYKYKPPHEELKITTTQNVECLFVVNEQLECDINYHICRIFLYIDQNFSELLNCGVYRMQKKHPTVNIAIGNMMIHLIL